MNFRAIKRTLVAAALAAAALAALSLPALAPAGFSPKLKAKLKTKRVIATRTVAIAGSDNPERYEVYCPRGTRPLGGGMTTSPPPDGTGAGAFPVSYERLGQQDGWHISVAQVGRTGSTSVTLQALCRKYSGDIDPVEHFVKSQTFKNVEAGETKQFTERCPRGKRLITGGYLSSHFFSNKGVYVTESRMADSRSWTITAHGVAGGSGGQVTAIAYCYKSRKPLLAEVQSPAAEVAPGTTATATAPRCPRGKQLIAGGYTAPSTVRVFDGGFAGLDTWTASAASYNSGAGSVVALGYCL